ncbi:SDR family oxidoreductase [Blastococcus sp. PRF04-17]|nr:SDR family oxidoreductase [Blastococcus sp. PRF04-17]UOY03356.1 SDR family oxidoreductase [Blastococcus sp. PRF04-17]
MGLGGLRANVIGPGYFHTELTADLLANPDDERRILGRIPMGRLGSMADLGGAAVFLLSDASVYLSGQLINIDGGWLAS